MTQEKFIRVCTEHKKHVPLIFTMAFPGANYWCPGCGATMRVPDKDAKVELTAALEKLRDKNLEETKEYLAAASVINTDKRVLFGGRRINKEDLPQEEKDRLQKIVDDHKFPIKQKKKSKDDKK